MKKFVVLALIVLSALPVFAAGKPDTGGQKTITLQFATAGDTNMLEFFQDIVGKAFTEKYPNIKVNVVGTGPGDDGSRAIYTKWKAQADAKVNSWDIDAGCVNESIMAEMIRDGLIEKYVPAITNTKYVNTPASEYALGTDVKGYVVPLFKSQIVLAYNPDRVRNPPRNIDELEAWIRANPNKFGYNGVTGGMSGVGFTAGWLYAKTGDYRNIAVTGPYNANKTAAWPAFIKQLKELPVVITQGNAGTLDMLNRGEIDMGPVWVDMLILWKSDGRMNPNIRMLLPEPGLPGQPMYLVIGSKAGNLEAARLFCDFIADPQVQAKYVVDGYGWYPGVDSVEVFKYCSAESKAKLFTEVTADELAKKGLALPLSGYMKDMQRVYAEVR
jgi:ABC-type uncharacterized transport system YnjBCD substrate-binding protein